MQVVHIAFTYLLLTLIYFHLESKILVKIPDSLLDSALALRGKEGDIVLFESMLPNFPAFKI